MWQNSYHIIQHYACPVLQLQFVDVDLVLEIVDDRLVLTGLHRLDVLSFVIPDVHKDIVKTGTTWTANFILPLRCLKLVKL